MAQLNSISVNGSNVADFIVDCVYTEIYWYQLYNSGWLIQGGRSTDITADYKTCTVTFPKEFRNTNYSAVTGSRQTADDGSWNGAYHIRTKSTTGMTIYCRGAGGGGRYVDWHCAGFAK